MFSLGLTLGLAAYLVYLSSRCFFRVEEGHLAVLVSFGAAERRAPEGPLRAYGPGLHRKLPWQRAHHVATMEQSVDLSGEEGGRTAMAEDGTLLRFDSVLRFHPMEDKLDQYVFGMRAPVEHITGLFTCILRNEIANFRDPSTPRPGAAALAATPGRAPGEYAGSYGIIRRDRKELNRRIETFCREQMGDRYGVRFNAVDLTDILPPDELAVALNAVINARTEAETRYARAEADCRQRVLASERGVDIARDRAAAVETEIATLARHLEGLERKGLLGAYVARRKGEALAEARALFLKEAP